MTTNRSDYHPRPNVQPSFLAVFSLKGSSIHRHRHRIQPGGLPVRLTIIVAAIVLTIFTAAFSQTRECDFTIAQLQYGGGGDWYANPSALPNLVQALRQRTDLPVCDTIATVSILDSRLSYFPFLYMTGHGTVRFSQEERTRLRRYLENGGFLWADDNYGLDESFRREVAALFPENPLFELPRNHPMYTSRYRLPGLPKIHEHDGKPAQGFGVVFNKRLVIYYTYSSDIGDGMEDLEVHHDGPVLHELALKMGINVITYFFSMGISAMPPPERQ